MSHPPNKIESYSNRARRWARETGFSVPNNLQLWNGVPPGLFLHLMDECQFDTPLLKPLTMNWAHFTTPKEGWPVRVEILPAYVTGFYWIGAMVGTPHPGSTRPRSVESIWYPTLVGEKDVPALLKLWCLDQLKWNNERNKKIWNTGWTVPDQCWALKEVTYFAISEDFRFLEVGRGKIPPLGNKKKVLARRGKEEYTSKMLRIGFCRYTLDSVLKVLINNKGMKLVSPMDAIFRNNNGELYYVPLPSKKNPEKSPKVLLKIAQMCAHHFHKYIIDGKRNFMSSYQLNEGEIREQPVDVEVARLPTGGSPMASDAPGGSEG